MRSIIARSHAPKCFGRRRCLALSATKPGAESLYERVDCKTRCYRRCRANHAIAGAVGRSNHVADGCEEYGAARKPNGQSAMLFLGKASAGPRYTLRPDHQSRRYAGGGPLSEDASGNATLWSVRGFRESATLHRRLKALV